MNGNNDKPPGMIETGKNGLMLFVLGAQIFTRPLQLFTTKFGTMGRRYLNSLPMGLGLLAFPFVCSMIDSAMRSGTRLPPQGNFGVFAFWIGLLVFRVYHGLKGHYLRKIGYSVHSQFIGYSIVPKLFKRTKDSDHKFRWDGALMIIVPSAVGVLLDSAQVVLYGVLAALASFVPAAWYAAEDQARIEAAEDARYDAEWITSELKRRGQNRWNKWE